jgi:hypothetical protein
MFEKAITYNATRRDFEMWLDGELIGYARTYGDAERTLNEVIAEIIASAITA